MKLLALDTSSTACSVALHATGDDYELHEEQPREHTRLLMPMIAEVLQKAKLQPADLDAIVLGVGPGSFIGMRIGASVAQGMAYAAGCPLVPVSSLAAIAQAVLDRSAAERVVVTQDAHMGEVYLGEYERGAEQHAVCVTEERLHPQARIDRLAGHSPGRFAAGQGWRRYPELLEANRDQFDEIVSIDWPHAGELLKLGQAAFANAGAVPPEDLQLAYLRQTVATPSL